MSLPLFFPLAAAATIGLQPLSFGEVNAPVRMTMFIDYSDPVSARFWDVTYPVLKTEFIDDGEMVLEVRHYPFSNHPGAGRAAAAVECARRQSDEVARELHADYLHMIEPKSPDEFWVERGISGVLGLDAAVLRECLDDADILSIIEQDITTAKDGHGFESVPSFFLQSKNGASSTIVGAKTHTEFIAAINALLTEKSTSPDMGVFSDVSSDHPYARAIGYVRSKGIVKGYDDGTYHPDERINRAEFLKIVLEAAGIEIGTQKPQCAYRDIDLNAWYAPYVCTATSAGIVQGDATNGGQPTFRPGDSINLAEALKIISSALVPLETIEEGGPWYMPYVTAFADAQLIPPTAQAIDHLLTRGEMADVIYRLNLPPEEREEGATFNH